MAVINENLLILLKPVSKSGRFYIKLNDNYNNKINIIFKYINIFYKLVGGSTIKPFEYYFSHMGEKELIENKSNEINLLESPQEQKLRIILKNNNTYKTIIQ
ncbi:hypothetical protein ACTFIY_007529 [Dictyostelium cf. discoideum]